MPVKRPVNKQPAPDQVLLRHWPPIAAVETVVTVIAHREITVARHLVRLIGLGQDNRGRAHNRGTAVAPTSPVEPETLGLFAVDVEKRRIDPQLVAGQTGQSLDVKRRARVRVLANPRNTICSENKNIPVMRLNKVVTEFIHKHLVARVDRASGDNFACDEKADRERR